MNLDPHIATSIVNSLKDIIHHEINLFDTFGTIIASTDSARIGSVHEGAQQAIATRSAVFVDPEDEQRMSGVRAGVNIPVLFNDSVVAVIGITGDRSEVEPFGNVIKKMTEILIRENWEQIGRFDRQQRETDLVSTLIQPQHDPEYASYLAATLNIDLPRSRIAVVGKLDATSREHGAHSTFLELLSLRITALHNTFYSLKGNVLSIFLDAEEEWQLHNLVEGIADDARSSIGHRVTFGIGTLADTPQDYWISYQQASHACTWARFESNQSVVRYEDLDLGVLAPLIPVDAIRRFEQRVFDDLSDEEIEGYAQTFRCYTQSNGSIKQCSESLFLHKNTLQNHLNRLAARTGYNPRCLADHTMLDLAFKLRSYRLFQEGAGRNTMADGPKNR